jgi:hypothetical protein
MSSAHGPAASSMVPNASVAQSSKRSGSVTYCAKCGLAVRGQFVRALHQVYHLDCFRCKVRLQVRFVRTDTPLGLRQGRCAKVLPHRGRRRTVPSMRARLLCPAQSNLWKV